MTPLHWIGAFVALCLLVYLGIALLKPETFE